MLIGIIVTVVGCVALATAIFGWQVVATGVALCIAVGIWEGVQDVLSHPRSSRCDADDLS